MTNFISPDRLHSNAKLYALANREPQSHRDWEAIVDYWAANVLPEINNQICKFMKYLFNCPLSDLDIDRICDSQRKHSRKGSQS